MRTPLKTWLYLLTINTCIIMGLQAQQTIPVTGGDATGGINLSDLSYQLLDMRGQPIRSEKVPGAETSINMAFLPPGNYFLKVRDGKREIRVFKIIKR